MLIGQALAAMDHGRCRPHPAAESPAVVVAIYVMQTAAAMDQRNQAISEIGRALVQAAGEKPHMRRG